MKKKVSQMFEGYHARKPEKLVGETELRPLAPLFLYFFSRNFFSSLGELGLRCGGMRRVRRRAAFPLG